MVLPYVSIIIPVYNEGRFLNRCLDSVTGQTFSDTEIIVINDASDDNSGSIIAEFSGKDKRIVAVENREKKGQGEARNTGIRESHGEYIFFLDADDYMPLDALETLCSIAKKHADDIIFGKTRSKVTVDKNYIFCEKRSINIKDHPPLLYNHSVWNKLIKRSFILDNNIFFDAHRHAEDIIFALKCNLLASKISITTKVTYYYNWDRQVENVTRQKVIDARENVLRAFNLVKDYGDPSLNEEMGRKTARNAYASMVRANRIFGREELFVHLKWWQPVLGGIPGPVLSEISPAQRRFCQLVIEGRFEEALNYWQKSRFTGNFPYYELPRSIHYLKRMFMQLVKRCLHHISAFAGRNSAE